MNKVIGAGATAQVIQVTGGEVLKVFKQQFDDAFADREYTIAEFAFRSGIPTPRPLGRLTWEDCPAIRYEFVAGPSLDKQLFRHFWKYKHLMEQFALLHESLNAIDATPLGQAFSMKERLRSLIADAAVAECTKRQALEAMEALPDGTGLVHGDFSVGNTIVSCDGMKITDWSTGTIGDPAADLANTWLGMGELIPRSQMNWIVRKACERAISCYRENYQPYADGEFAQRATSWMLPVSVAKLGAQQMAGVRKENLEILSRFIESM